MMREGNVPTSGAELSKIIVDYLTFLEQMGRRESTITYYRQRLINLAAWLTATYGVAVEDAQYEHLAAYRAALDVAPQSVASYMTAVRGLYQWLHLSRRREDNPAWGIPVPRKRRGLPRPSPEEETWFAIDNAPHRIRPWLVLAAGQGARCCEIASLERPDIMETAYPRPLIRLNGKGGKSRIEPMSAWVWGELQAYGLPRRGPVFRRYDGKRGPNSAKIISQFANKYLRDIGCDFTIHQMRHRFATVALAAVDGNLRVVQELLGHADPATTAIYTAFSDTDAARAVDGTQPPAVRPVRAVGDQEPTQPMPIRGHDEPET